MNQVQKVFIFILLVLSIQSCAQERETRSPKESLNFFYSYEGAEDQLMDPLIVAGQEIVPLLIMEIKNKDMHRRRYAIGALGNLQAESAMPLLESLLRDSTEKDYFRCDALNAISLIDFIRAKELSSNFKESQVECLREMTESILSLSQEEWTEKTYMVRTMKDDISNKHY